LFGLGEKGTTLNSKKTKKTLWDVGSLWDWEMGRAIHADTLLQPPS